MTTDRTTTLIHRAIDQEATPTERAELDARLADDDAARTSFRQLSRTAALLESVEAVAPPPDLKLRIMRALPEGRYHPAAPAAPSLIERIRATLGDALSARPAFALAYAVVLGMVMGAGLLGALSGPLAPAGEAVGTIGAAAPADAAALEVETPGVSGSVRAWAEGDGVFVEVALTTTEPARVGVVFDEERLGWRGISREEDGTEAALALGDGTATLTLSGSARYLLRFEATGPAPPLTLSVAQGATALGERTVQPR